MTLNNRALNLLKFYCRVRSVHYAAQYWALNRVSQWVGFKTPIRYQDRELLELIGKGLEDLIEADLARIQSGFAPISALSGSQSLGFFKVAESGFGWIQSRFRRTQGNAKDFSRSAQDYIEGLPEYYVRNFHFQTDGYLGDSSAEVYDYEVDLLFSGATDAMRRLLIAPFKKHFRNVTDGKGLKFLEIGPGTGRATRFMKMAFPKAKIIGIDLSEPYLKVARRELSPFKGVHFLQGDGTQLPFKDAEFDGVYSVFLFHELPLEVRKQILNESLRVLKPEGVLGYIDSIQKGDIPDFDFFLKEFPKNFHEPFYANYITHPMDQLIQECEVQALDQGRGLLSKYQLVKRLEK